MSKNNKDIKIKDFVVSNDNRFTLIAGPCVIENREHALKTASLISDICNSLGLNFIYKSSFDKANRSSVESYRGPGLEEGIKIFNEIKVALSVPVITDIHEIEQVEKISEVAIETTPLPFQDARNYQVSSEKLKTETGFEASIELERGINEVYDLISSNRIKDINDPRYSNQSFLQTFGVS